MMTPEHIMATVRKRTPGHIATILNNLSRREDLHLTPSDRATLIVAAEAVRRLGVVTEAIQLVAKDLEGS